MPGSVAPPSRPKRPAPLPPEDAFRSPGVTLVVDERGRLRDRSPRAADDPVFGRLGLGQVVAPALREEADRISLIHEGTALDALVFARGERARGGGLDEREVAALLHRLRNLVSTLVASFDAEEMVAGGPAADQLGQARRREIDRLVGALTGLAHAFAPAGGRAFVDLELLLRRAIDSARGGARRRAIVLRLEGARDARRGRTGDEGLLGAALEALVGNAIDASADGGEIHVRVEAGPASVTILVEDDGPGLLPPTHGDLGEPFATSKRGGLGLGLVVAQRAAVLHGGELRVATRPSGSGTSASLWIPTAPS
jgi:signal transduction histidine kinase